MSALDRAVLAAFRKVLLPIVETPQFQARLAAALAAEVAGGQVLAADAAARPAPAVTRAMLRDAETLDARKAEANRKRSETQKRNAEARRAAREQAERQAAEAEAQAVAAEHAEMRRLIAAGTPELILAPEYRRPAVRAEAEPPAASPVVAHSMQPDRFEPFPDDAAEAQGHILAGKGARWVAEEYGWPLAFAQAFAAKLRAEQKAPIATSPRDARA